MELPAEVTRELLTDSSLLGALLQWRDMTPLYLGYKSGIGPDVLFRPPSGKRHLSEETARRLAAALDVPAHWLLA